MSKQIKRELALFLAVVLVFLCLPISAQAEAVPAFKKTYSVFYENRANAGLYDITVKNVKKGYILKWSITGKGKDYASFDVKKITAQAAKVTNRLTINSRGEMAFAAGERIRITVKVYTAKNELVDKLTFAGKLQSKAKTIEIDTSGISDLKHITAGQQYQFRASMTPANTTSKIYWQVKDAAGTDCSSEISETGLWTPTKSGDFTITALARNTPTGQPLCTKSVQATVGSFVENVNQTAADGVYVTFNSPVASQYKESDFSIKSGEATVLVKKVKYSEDGKTAYITTATNFIDGRKYTVSCAGYDKEFTASVGKPVELSITTANAQVGKYTKIEYVLLDANGIDVTGTIDSTKGTFRCTADVYNGLIDQQTNRLYMTTIGGIATVTMTYISADGTVNLKDTKAVLCVAQKADEAVDTHFTLTNSAQTPSYKGDDVRTIAVGDTMYAHFMALDADDEEITYDSIVYNSNDPDSLIISQDGKITPIKTGVVMVVVTASQGSYPVTYTYSITINEARYLADIELKETAIAMSNTRRSVDYQKEIPVTALDQYGGSFVLNGEAGFITETAGRKVLAAYDTQDNCIRIQTQGEAVGVYNYLLTVNLGGRTISKNFTVIVSEPNVNGTPSYKIESSAESMDLSVDAGTTGNKIVKLRLAEYRGGVFYSYKNFTSAVIRKGSAYYSNDMVTCSTAGAITIPGSSSLTLTPLSIIPDPNNSAVASCRKAEPGTYTVTLYYTTGYNFTQPNNLSESINIEFTDGQSHPDYTLRSLTTQMTAANALQMVIDCIYVPDGEILDCTAAGTIQTGRNIAVKSGEQIHINTITVKSKTVIATGQTVYVNHVINIGRTLTNK